MKEDQILIEQLNASSMEAFSALYDKYAGMVFNFTHAILKDTYLSEDITQSCFALMWSRRTSISPDGNVPAWLYVVARQCWETSPANICGSASTAVTRNACICSQQLWS